MQNHQVTKQTFCSFKNSLERSTFFVGAAPNKCVKVEHLYSCIHFCGIAAGSSGNNRRGGFFPHHWNLNGRDGYLATYHQADIHHHLPRYGMKFQTFQEEMWWKGSLIGAAETNKNNKKNESRRFITWLW